VAAEGVPYPAIERRASPTLSGGFRMLKSEIEIAPVFHRLPDRICAYALICFIALIPVPGHAQPPQGKQWDGRPHP